MAKKKHQPKLRSSFATSLFRWLLFFFWIAGLCSIVAQVVVLWLSASRSGVLPSPGAIASIVASGLAVLGALAAYFRFFSERSWVGRLEFAHSVVPLEANDARSPWLVSVTVTNIGSRAVTFTNVLLLSRPVSTSDDTAPHHWKAVAETPPVSLGKRLERFPTRGESQGVYQVMVDSDESLEFCFVVKRPTEGQRVLCEAKLEDASYEWYVPIHIPNKRLES